MANRLASSNSGRTESSFGMPSPAFFGAQISCATGSMIWVAPPRVVRTRGQRNSTPRAPVARVWVP